MVIPIPAPMQPKSKVQDLKTRLDWGEPALTIIDVRGRKAFNASHIMGAVSVPMTELGTESLSSLELIRDIYVYGATDEETAHAATRLHDLGYQHVSELIGGLTAWQASGYPVES